MCAPKIWQERAPQKVSASGPGVLAPAALQRPGTMALLKKQHRWFLVAGLAGMAASQLTDQLVSSSWSLAAGKEPPEDPSMSDVDWTSALLFTAATGAIVAIAELMGK